MIRDRGCQRAARLSGCILGGVGCRPQRAGIDPTGIAFEHSVIEFARGRGLAIHALEVENVLPRRLDMPRAAVGIERPMAGDKFCLYLIERRQPCLAPSLVRFREIGMGVVVHGIPGYHQPDRRLSRCRQLCSSGSP